MTSNGLTVRQLLSKEEQNRTAARGHSLNIDTASLPLSLETSQVMSGEHQKLAA